ncbi:MAG TPA: alpha-hydroxy acid oxidase [Acidimicrobiales bacterium]|nr:alpha-hydroxy acid oxidase [Acidimicrobiales bacterium]
MSERARSIGRRLRAAYRDPGRLTTVERARTLARRRVPRAVFDYLDGGAETESTMEANRAAMMAVGFRPRMGVTPGDPAPDISTTVLGRTLSMPVILGPVGFTRMMDRHGDVAAARAAGEAGTIFTLSSMSGHTMEEVAAAATGPAWFQLYFLGGRPGAAQLVERAQRAGFEALVVTMDTQIPGNRERESRNRVKPPLQMNLRNMVKFAPQVALHPDWLMEFARDRFQLDIVNATTMGPPEHPMSVEEALMWWTAAPPRWEDFSWLRQQWRGPIIAKGIVTGDDARRAVDCGVSAIVVSNHGGRQLDGMPATLPALVEVLDAVGDSVEVLVDGGVRRGSDVVRALSLGARAVMIGRAWAYGLAAAGEPGITAILSMLAGDFDRTLRLVGCDAATDLDRSFIRYPPGWDATPT